MVYSSTILKYLSILPDITKVKLVSSNSVTIFGTVSFDQKAVSPGLCNYHNLGLGMNPIIKPEDAVKLLENGYSKMLQKLINDFKNERSWIKNGEVFFVQLDYFVALPVAVFYLSQSGQWDDVLLRLKTVLMYLNSCNECLRLAKVTGRPPSCKFFCKECFKLESVCPRHTLKPSKTGTVTAGHVRPVWNLFHRELTSNVEDFVFF